MWLPIPVPYWDVETLKGGGGHTSRPLEKGGGSLPKKKIQSFWPQFDLKIREGRAPCASFLDPSLNTHNPHCKSFCLEICDISRLFTHFSQLFPAIGSESHFFILLEVGKSVVCKSHESPWYLQKSQISVNSPLCPCQEGAGGEGRGAFHWLVHNRASFWSLNHHFVLERHMRLTPLPLKYAPSLLGYVSLQVVSVILYSNT